MLQPAKTTPNAAASTAAVQAFLANRASNANLSNAAAAAALRSRPTTPTPVGDIQTKRRMQRSGSLSSNGSARPGLQRQGSSGSMTERTFRDPSPSRSAAAPLYSDDPPPVPSLPKGYVSPPPARVKPILRPASVEPPTRVKSPPPKAGRGVSLDRGPGVLPGQLNNPQLIKAVNNEQANQKPTRESINFSRPMSPTNSPPASPLTRKGAQIPRETPQPGSQPPMKANIKILRDGEVENIQHSVQETASRPVKKKKKRVAKEMAEGSHLAAGGVGGKPMGSALDNPKRPTSPTSLTPSPLQVDGTKTDVNIQAQAAPQKKKKKRVASSSGSQGSYASDSDSAASDQSFSADRSRQYNTRAAGGLAKQPSIVREDREGEEQEENERRTLQVNTRTAINGNANLAAVPTESKTVSKHKKSASQPAATSKSVKEATLDVPKATSSSAPTRDRANLQQPRPKSLSPGRATHFLAQPTYETFDGIKHEPPGRSVSPAKSALKHSPSSRGASPVGSISGGPGRLHSQFGSEASDTASVRSDEGLKSAPSRKKSVRVSFDEDSVVVGRAATPPATDSPTILSPQHKDNAGKGFMGFGSRMRSGGSPNESDQDIGMEPTPTLPSFGSIRGKVRDGPMPKTSQREDPVTPPKPLSDLFTSSDQAIGGVFARDFESRQSVSSSTPQPATEEQPLPPEVTTVEGTGYHSDTDNSVHSEAGVAPSLNSTLSPLPMPDQSEIGREPTSAEGTTKDLPSERQNGTVPLIAVQPATPGIGTTDEDAEEWFKMPGGFDASNDDPDIQTTPSTSVPLNERMDEKSLPPAVMVDHHATDPTPASLGIAEPEPPIQGQQAASGAPLVGHVAESLQQQAESVQGDESDESDDTGNSIYSDAAEDMSDFEGDGFGSINAIVDSPAHVKAPLAANLIPESPDQVTPNAKADRTRPSKRVQGEASEPGPEHGWDRAQEYWSSLSQNRKAQLERAAIPGAADDVPSVPAVPIQEPTGRPKKKKVVKRTHQPSDPPLPPWPDREFRRDVVRPESPRAAGMKQSMRTAPSSQDEPRQTQMRTSMRNRPPAKSALRNSVQIPDSKQDSRAPVQKRSRPVSAVAMVDYDKASSKPAPKHNRAASLGVAPASLTPVTPQPKKNAKSAPRRVASTGSDSSSSFKKARPSTSEGGRFTMRRTMRGSSVDERPQSAQARRNGSMMSARSASPPTRRPFSTAGSGTGMRTSMRDSMDSGIGSRRTKSPTRSFGFGKKSSKSKATVSKPGSRFSSRFGDSSDEDDGPVHLRSRFADSSDEDEPTKLTPVRGIPRRIDEGDSTDLEDSSAETSPKPKPKEKPQLLPVETSAKVNGTKLEGSALATGSLRGGQPQTGTDLQSKRPAEKEKKKRSFFGSLGSSSKKQSQPPLQISDPKPVLDPLDPSYIAPAAAAPALLPASPQSPKAGNGKAAASPTTTLTSAQPSPKSPKLQRRNTPKRLTSDSWPLPSPPPPMPASKAEKARPSTSDGMALGSLRKGTLRPDMGGRRSTVQEEGTAAATTTNGTSGVGDRGGKAAATGKKKRFPMLRKALRLGD
ncbi:MAG: hypothetical protein Q9190_004885 [Brigantiaea leucoxantha]